MIERILSLAAAIARPSEAEMPLLETLCAAAEREAAGRLREGVAPEDCASSFTCAAAMLAAAGLTAGRSSGGVEQFSAGDVSLRLKDSGGSGETADALRYRAECLMRRYWTDGTFAFAGVRG